MWRSITDLWPNLIRNQQNDEGAEVQAEEGDDNPNRATADQLASLRESTAALYKNLNWTRLIDLDHHQPEERRNWPVAPDIADEFDELFIIDEDALPEFQPLFNPVEFAARNPEPLVVAWRLSSDRLK